MDVNPSGGNDSLGLLNKDPNGENGENANFQTDAWKSVKGKINRESPQKRKQTKQTKLDNFWLGINNSNQFSSLENEVEDVVPPVKLEKPPPLFLLIKWRTHNLQ